MIHGCCQQEGSVVISGDTCLSGERNSCDISRKRIFWDLLRRMKHCRKLYFHGGKPPSFQGPISLSRPKGRSLILPLARLKSVSWASGPCWSNLIQHQASSVWVPSCNPLVHCMWGPQGHMVEEGTQMNARKQDQESTISQECQLLCLRDYISPNFQWLALAAPLLDSDFCSQIWLTNTFPRSTPLHWACVQSPLCPGSFPSDLQGLGWRFPGECEIAASWWSYPDGHAYNPWPPLCSFPINCVSWKALSIAVLTCFTILQRSHRGQPRLHCQHRVTNTLVVSTHLTPGWSNSCWLLCPWHLEARVQRRKPQVFVLVTPASLWVTQSLAQEFHKRVGRKTMKEGWRRGRRWKEGGRGRKEAS